MDAAAPCVKTNIRPELVCEAGRLQSRQVGSHDPHKLLINVLSWLREKIRLLLISKLVCEAYLGVAPYPQDAIKENCQRLIPRWNPSLRPYYGPVTQRQR